MYGLQDKGWSAYLNKILGDSAAARDWIYSRADKQEEIAQKAAAAEREAYEKSPGFTYNQLISMGYPPDMANQITLSKHYPEFFKSVNEKLIKNENDQNSQQELLGLFGSMYGAIESNLELNTEEGNEAAKGFISQLKSSITGEDVKKYSRWLNADRVKEVLDTANLYEKVAAGQMTWKDAKIKMYRDTFDLDTIHNALKSGNKLTAEKLINENLRVIATGDGLVNKRHYDIGETRKILGELQVLKDVADGRITYDDALIQLGLKKTPKEKTPTSNVNDYSKNVLDWSNFTNSVVTGYK